MSDTFELLQLLKNNEILYNPSELNEKNSVDMIKSINYNYINILFSTINKTLNQFGNNLIGFNADADYEDPDYNFIQDEYVIKFITLPITWQEIICLIYISLQIHRYVENNSRIISLGESPLKLVFVQEVLNTNERFKEVLEQNSIASDVEYTYFPASKLNNYVFLGRIKHNDIFKFDKRDDGEFSFNLDNFILTDITHIVDKVDEIVIGHFHFFKLDPISIISDSKKVYYQDRAESYRSLLTLICFYGGMCSLQRLNEEQRMDLYQKLYIIGFDTKDQNAQDDEDNIIIDRLNQLLYRVITNKTDTLSRDVYHIYKKNFYLPDIKIETCLNDDFNVFSNQTNILLKLIIFLTIPEKTFNRSRCLKSCPITIWGSNCPEEIQKKMQEKGILYIKEAGKDGFNCNLINLFLMNTINKLEPEYLNNLIKNLDNPNLERLYINNSIDYMSINQEISSYVRSLNYNSNIFNNLLNNKLIGNKINITIETFLKTQGLLNNCNYDLPL
jgi:hypothetical protein